MNLHYFYSNYIYNELLDANERHRKHLNKTPIIIICIRLQHIKTIQFKMLSAKRDLLFYFAGKLDNSFGTTSGVTGNHKIVKRKKTNVSCLSQMSFPINEPRIRDREANIIGSVLSHLTRCLLLFLEECSCRVYDLTLDTKLRLLRCHVFSVLLWVRCRDLDPNKGNHKQTRSL
jgi:hypothetical protein